MSRDECEGSKDEKEKIQMTSATGNQNWTNRIPAFRRNRRVRRETLFSYLVVCKS